MIEVKNVKKSFGDKTILHDVSVNMETGKCNLIIGSSGSGKTVLLKCIVGLFTPDAGEISFDGLIMKELSTQQKKSLRQQIGMLFQGSALFDSMTVERNIKFPLDMFTTLSHKEKMTKIDEVLERVNMVGANKKFPSEISGGMKKRVGIARSIVLNPKYLFCDEPNSGLDPQTSLVIDKLIKDITQEYKIIQFFIVAVDNVFVGAYPLFFAFVHVKYVVAYFHHTIHVVGYDHSGYFIFLGDVFDQFVNYQ